MTATEETILWTLRELEAAARAMPAANPKPDLRPLFTRLDALAAQLPKNANPELVHYLQRKSYEKARLWLEGTDPEKGTCRR
jgi:hypothetical protein